MTDHTPGLHMLCGKLAAGKSTLAAQLGQAPNTIVVVQDQWMARLWPEEGRTIADYARDVQQLRAAMGPHLAKLLRLGLSVVLDWPANRVVSRRWMRSVFEAAGAAHRLHVLDKRLTKPSGTRLRTWAASECRTHRCGRAEHEH